jgi:SAM-dependent methyltransferase
VDAQELQDRIDAYPIWNYRFEFENGVSTPLGQRDRVNRQVQRRRYFFDALLGLTGGSLRGRRVLDLGCGAGFWALAAIEAGADFVLGVDARSTYIEQAALVFEAKGVDPARYRLEEANIFGYELREQFDVVLCLGLLNVVAKPVELFELMCSARPELIVIDTGLSRAGGKMFEVSRLTDARNKIDYELVLVPSRAAVGELAKLFGLRSVALARNITDYRQMEDYERRERLAFICSDRVALDSLAAEPEPPANPWAATAQDVVRDVRRRIGR